MSKNIISKELAEQICKEVTTVADFCRKVGWQPRGNNYKIFYKYVKEYNLDTSHFTGQKTNLGNRLGEKNNISNEEYFIKNKLKKSSEVIKRLLKFNLLEYKCSYCGISKWRDQSISLQLHHINGDHFDNTLNNLILLCPNCHSQTDSFAGKKNKGKSNHKYKRIPKYKCAKCGKPLRHNPKTGLCINCLREQRRVNKSALNEN